MIGTVLMALGVVYVGALIYTWIAGAVIRLLGPVEPCETLGIKEHWKAKCGTRVHSYDRHNYYCEPCKARQRNNVCGWLWPLSAICMAGYKIAATLFLPFRLTFKAIATPKESHELPRRSDAEHP